MKKMTGGAAELFLRYLLFAPRTDSDRAETRNQFDAQAALVRAKRTVQSPLPVMKCGKGGVRNKAIRVASSHLCANIAVLRPESLFPRHTGALALLLLLLCFQPLLLNADSTGTAFHPNTESHSKADADQQALNELVLHEKVQDCLNELNHSKFPCAVQYIFGFGLITGFVFGFMFVPSILRVFSIIAKRK